VKILHVGTPAVGKPPFAALAVCRSTSR